MNLGNWLIDKKIMGLNISIDMEISEYWEMAQTILEKNEFQRRRVRESSGVYSMLKKDLLAGCIMPPIILAVTESYGQRVAPVVKDIIEKDLREPTPEQKRTLESLITNAIKDKEVLILDGLQRSFTIQAALQSDDNSAVQRFQKHIIRVEIYLGLSKMGILYRMLTLNTGQTPMSFRHQLEMLYHDYLDSNGLPDGIKIVREIDESRVRGIGRYKYSDVIDLFYAYSTGNPQSVDKETFVNKLKEIDFLQTYNPDSEDMIVLLTTYNKFVNKIMTLSNNWEFSANYVGDPAIPRPFGTNIPSIFGKVQAMTGFGSACARLIKFGKNKKITDVEAVYDQLIFEKPVDESLSNLTVILNEISSNAKRVGDAQRGYFDLAFRELLNNESDSYCNLTGCWITAKEKYDMLF